MIEPAPHVKWRVSGRPVKLSDITVPIFSVGTQQDHVAPWRSVFKLHALTDAEQTFVLAAGGHNVGIVNPPGLACPRPATCCARIVRQSGC